MSIEVVEYLVFISIIIFVIILAVRFKLNQEPDKEHVPYILDINKCESPIEKRVYNGLLQHDLHATPQHRQGKYRIDLAFPSSMLAIECDGKAYHSSPTQKAHDKKKDQFLKSKGWTVLRFTGRRIHRDLPGVVKKVKDNLN